MGKVVKGIAIGVGVVVASLAVAATGGAALGPVLSATVGKAFALGGAIGLKGITAGIVGGALIGGGLSALSYLQPKRPQVEATGAAASVGAQGDPDPDDYYVFGRTFVPIQRVYLEEHGSEGQSLLQVFAHASHQISQYLEYYHNTDLLAFSGAGSGEIGGDFPPGTLRIFSQLGTNNQIAITPSGTTWTGRGRGVAHTLWQFTQNQEKPDTISQNLRVYLEGAVNYDPRQDFTVGGSMSGPQQRAVDPFTWTYDGAGGAPTPQGSNLALVVLRYILGEYQNGVLRWGIGADPANINYTAFIAAANFCDEISNGEPRLHIGGAINCSTPASQVLETFMGHCGGWCGRNAAGLWDIYIPQDDLAIPDWTVTTADLVGEISISDQPVQELFNAIQGRCAPKDGLGQLVAYPEVSEPDLVTQDGGKYAQSVDYPFFDSFARAQYQARQRIRRARFDRSVETVLSFAFFRIQKNQTVELNAPEFGYQNEVMRVVAKTIVPDVGIAVVLAEESSTIYDQTEPIAPNPTIGEVLQFDPSRAVSVLGFSLAAVDITGDTGETLNGIRASWAEPSARVARTEIRYKRASDSDYIFAPSIEQGSSETTFTSLPPDTVYTVEIRHITIFDVPGAWASDTVTTGSNTLQGPKGDKGDEGDPGADGLLPFGFKRNFNSFTDPNPGELFIHGSQNGQPADINGTLVYNGTEYTIPRAAGGNGVLTSIANTLGWICFDISGANFTVAPSAPYSTQTAFVYQRDGVWYYDTNPGETQFTPNANHVAIGTCLTGSADFIEAAGPIAPVGLLAAPTAKAYVSRGASFPSNPFIGQWFERTDLQATFQYNGSTWDRLGGDYATIDNTDQLWIDNGGFSRLDENGDPLSWDLSFLNVDLWTATIISESSAQVGGNVLRLTNPVTQFGVTFPPSALKQDIPGNVGQLVLAEIRARAVQGAFNIGFNLGGQVVSPRPINMGLLPSDGWITGRFKYRITETTISPQISVSVNPSGGLAIGELDYIQLTPIFDAVSSIVDVSQALTMDSTEFIDGEAVIIASAGIYTFDEDAGGTSNTTTRIALADGGDARLIRRLAF